MAYRQVGSRAIQDGVVVAADIADATITTTKLDAAFVLPVNKGGTGVTTTPAPTVTASKLFFVQGS
jgi:hypothetical protein